MYANICVVESAIASIAERLQSAALKGTICSLRCIYFQDVMYVCMYVCRGVADVVEESELYRGLLEYTHFGRAQFQAAQHNVLHAGSNENVSQSKYVHTCTL